MAGTLQQNFASVLTRERVTAATARAVAALYDELWDEPPDESTRRAAYPCPATELRGCP